MRIDKRRSVVQDKLEKSVIGAEISVKFFVFDCFEIPDIQYEQKTSFSAFLGGLLYGYCL